MSPNLFIGSDKIEILDLGAAKARLPENLLVPLSGLKYLFVQFNNIPKISSRNELFRRFSKMKQYLLINSLLWLAVIFNTRFNFFDTFLIPIGNCFYTRFVLYFVLNCLKSNPEHNSYPHYRSKSNSNLIAKPQLNQLNLR